MTKKELKALRKLERSNREAQGGRSDLIKWIILGGGSLLFILLFGILIFFIKQEQNKPIALSPQGYARGGESAKATLVEFGDFQCPACKAYESFVRKLSGDFDGKLKLVFKNFPLTSVHPNAMLAARVAVAAGNQGKFWEMHDWLYDNQEGWAQLTGADAQTKMVDEAKTLKLDIERFNKDINSKETADAISSTQNEGIKIGVDATPTFYVNNKKIENPQSYDAFKKIIADAIK